MQNIHPCVSSTLSVVKLAVPLALVALAPWFSLGGDSLYLKGAIHSVSNDAPLTETDAVRLTSGARGVAKTGSGTYTLPHGNVVGKDPFDLLVHQGRVVVADGGGVPPVTEAPIALLNLASFWVDASVNAETNGSGVVTTWYDCRETSEEGVFGNTYCRATTLLTPKDGNGAAYAAVLPTVRTPSGVARPMINFGGMTTGSGMNFSKTYSAVRHVFAVVDFQTSYGFFLGAGVNMYPILHPSNYTQPGVSGTYSNTDSYPTTGQAEFLVNGVRCNPLHTAVKTGLQLIELHADDHTSMQGLGTFFIDRGIGGRYGGDFIGEVLVYNGATHSLSVAERHRISDYLMNKWGIVHPQGAVAVKLAKGSEVDVKARDIAKLSGQGVLVKSGTGEEVFRPVAESRLTGVSVAVEGGTLVADVRELNYAPKAGETVTETVDSFARRTVTSVVDPAKAAAGRTEFKGGGVGLRLGDLDPAVTNLVADSQQVILGRNGLGGAALPTCSGVATIANASFEEAFGDDNWVTENNDGGVWRLTLTTDGEVEDWRLGNPTDPFRQDCRHARYYAPDGKMALCLHNGSIVRGKVSVPVDGDYLFSFQATGRFTYDNEELTFSLIDAANVTNTFASCITKCGDGFRPFCLPVRGLKAGSHTLRIVGCHHWSVRGYYNPESFAIIDDLRLVHLADGSAVEGAVPVPNGSFEVTQFTTFNRRVDNFGTNDIACAGWTFAAPSSTGDDVAPVARYMPGNYMAQGHPYGEWELHFNGDAGRATTLPFSIPAGRWRLRCKYAMWAFQNNAWGGHTHGRSIAPAVGVKVRINGEERCDMVSAVTGSYEFQTVTFGRTIEVAATDKIEIEVRQNTPNSGTGAANMKVDDFEFVPETVAGELVKNGSFQSGMNNWFSCGKSGSSLWVQTFDNPSDANWGDQRFDGDKGMCFTRLAACTQRVDFAAAGVYRLSFWARSRVSNYGKRSTSQYGGGKLRASLVDSIGAQAILAETPRILSTNFFETAVLFKVPTAGTYALKFEGLDADDRTTILDAVSVSPVADASAPVVSENLDIRLAADTKLRLDYDGEVRIDRLRIGNKRFYGTVDAADPSGLVTGIGSIQVTGRKPGALLVIR